MGPCWRLVGVQNTLAPAGVRQTETVPSRVHFHRTSASIHVTKEGSWGQRQTSEQKGTKEGPEQKEVNSTQSARSSWSLALFEDL